MQQKLKAERALRSLTQAQVAEILNITTASYGSKEREETEFTLSEIKILLKLFGKKFEELF